ncbi:acetylornithine deacetylase/succinyl-diaminopimelate desuccinylase-like protein [Streptomyces sp. SAI-208]|uniref:M20/M25/M40 family metallo-hydrolase n=1 Tax=unclassified Streptomyces TaxID=2593676 RepID=UPI0024768FD8|nr:MULTISPECIES: M20/M25/M40 family metallo-hydrolase [unclassified Streptomyces]MDH6520224.1 acetylornithine deacetylase/succinyl-diaminopimelate desuccinylase-like protein [Streptomyces sp. SAI-090]MDH6552439.1 acetylornithine deacetylase/succinyl-diaminopimelate desuccinylase-like protein [Streptomyces sp. SAI-041]MDH6571526.1 acetylornithine deacetylase/succinyl-diaminopimelate desuccinylase-like protein [Streptomyces sp. SAI-117]MDH6583512.1 acetylornithine deacetylase/succinyl-diaminopime
MSDTDTARGVTGEDEVVDLCRELIRFDTSNYGDHSGPGERKAAEWVAGKLAEVGLDPQIFESHPGRASTVARIAGEDPSRPALLIHGHLDVVPANAQDWTHHPFSGEVADGCVWGRGAVDMKDMDAMTLAVVRDRLRSGRRPPRDIVLAFLADEEAGGTYGARHLVDHHPDLFEGVTEAISEVGGFSFTVNEQRRLYLIQTAEKGMHWMKLTVAGTAGHGSMIHRDNAITELSEAVARLGRHKFPVRVTKTTRAFLDELGDALGTELDPEDMEGTLARLGGIAKLIGATLSNTANPTQLGAGYKVNVIPGEATAHVDGRFLPGHEEEFLADLDKILGPKVRREDVHSDKAVETTFDGALVDAMQSALVAEDPAAKAIPYMLSGGTDAKSFDELGIRGFGFAPLKLPPELDFAGMFHGVDERVPVDGLKFGVRVLDRFIDAS